MFTLGDILKHKNERAQALRISRIRENDPALCFGKLFSYWQDINGRDQWTLDNDHGFVVDILGRIDPASFDLTLFVDDIVIEQYSGITIPWLLSVFERIPALMVLYNSKHQPKPDRIIVNGMKIDREDLALFLRSAEAVSTWKDQQWEARNEARKIEAMDRDLEYLRSRTIEAVRTAEASKDGE